MTTMSASPPPPTKEPLSPDPGFLSPSPPLSTAAAEKPNFFFRSPSPPQISSSNQKRPRSCPEPDQELEESKPLFRDDDEEHLEGSFKQPPDPILDRLITPGPSAVTATFDRKPDVKPTTIDLTLDTPPPTKKIRKSSIPPSQSSIVLPPRAEHKVPIWKRQYVGAFMCEGYMVYSATRLSENDRIWLTRPIVRAQSTSASLPKAFKTKKGADHAVQVESKANGTFGRLNESFAKWVVCLIDLGICEFEGNLVCPPPQARVGDTVQFYLKVYFRKEAFGSPDPLMLDGASGQKLIAQKKKNASNSFYEGQRQEGDEDRWRIERQASINKLLEILELQPASSASQARSSTRSFFENRSPASQLDEPERIISQNNISLVYRKAAAKDVHLPRASPPEGFKLELRPYQQQGLHWLIEMEGSLDQAREEVSIHPLWEEYVFPIEQGTLSFTDPEKFYYNPYMGDLTLEFPRASRKCRGGVLSDEMGMGKTIQMAALICSMRKTQEAKNGSSDEHEDKEAEEARVNQVDAGTYQPSPLKKNKPMINQNMEKKKKENIRRKTGATLVVCPLTLLDQWKDELERCEENLKVSIYHGGPGKNLDWDDDDEPDVVITTYGIVGSEWTELDSKDVFAKHRPIKTGLYSLEWHRIILDEAHNIKNRIARASKACYELSGERRWALTGTPIVNRLEDLASLLHFIKLEPWGNFSFYRSFVTVPFSKKDPKALEVVQVIIESVLLRREKSMLDSSGQPIVSLPNKQVKLTYLTMSAKENSLYSMIYRNAKAEFLAFVGKGTVLNNVTAILAILVRLRQAVLHPSLVLRKLGIKMTEDVGENERELLERLLKEYGAEGGGFAGDQVDKLKKVLEGEVTDGLEDECVMCLDVMDSRVFLPCMHSFCKACLMAYVESKMGDETKCVTCEKEFKETDLVEYVRTGNGNEKKPARLVGTSSEPVTPDPTDLQPTIKDEEEAEKEKSNPNEGGGGYLRTNTFVSSTKLEALIDDLVKVRTSEPEFSAVIFSQFTGFLDFIEKVLTRDHFRYVRLDGKLSQKKRKDVLRDFNEPADRGCILLCSLKVAGVGLNLVKANRVYMMDTWWNGAIEGQLILSDVSYFRVHRFGQTRETVVVRYLMSHSIEERMLSLQNKKRAIVERALSGSGSGSGPKTTLEDLEAIFAD
ncbi:hypothetical protein CROQUDRAFT_83943 [Cronartium quercuum f. sp. fusiforme G11]|uniref:DNA repair protein RAD5 n=1 Tax=Cronartium quercuum f. sp. fusiforme G11 TaxID=708437 RepID=A0A9P6N721_9BASI|nr:hypothetical protein CROQUDRAFT_83943 [Cronartium quercuum f. sp. fusiforme G11]